MINTIKTRRIGSIYEKHLTMMEINALGINTKLWDEDMTLDMFASYAIWDEGYIKNDKIVKALQQGQKQIEVNGKKYKPHNKTILLGLNPGYHRDPNYVSQSYDDYHEKGSTAPRLRFIFQDDEELSEIAGALIMDYVIGIPTYDGKMLAQLIDTVQMTTDDTENDLAPLRERLAQACDEIMDYIISRLDEPVERLILLGDSKSNPAQEWMSEYSKEIEKYPYVKIKHYSTRDFCSDTNKEAIKNKLKSFIKRPN